MKKKPIDDPDLTNTSQSYWDKVLSSLGLSKDRGLPPQFWIDRGGPNEKKVRQTLSVGGMRNIEGVQEEQYRKRTGRVTSKGHGPDD